MSCQIISYHIMSCHVMSYHVISYHIMSCHVISYHIMSCHVMSYHIISCHIISSHVMSCHVISYHIISYHIISYHIISYHIISCHVMSYHVMSCHVISYHVMSSHNISYHIMSCHVISYHIISCHVISYHVMSYHIISYHIIYHSVPQSQSLCTVQYDSLLPEGSPSRFDSKASVSASVASPDGLSHEMSRWIRSGWNGMVFPTYSKNQKGKKREVRLVYQKLHCWPWTQPVPLPRWDWFDGVLKMTSQLKVSGNPKHQSHDTLIFTHSTVWIESL